MEIIFIRYIVPILAFVPVLAGLVLYRKLDRAAKVLFYYLAADNMVNVAMALIGSHGKNNLFFFHYFTVIEFLFFTAFFIVVFKSKPITQRLVAVAVLFVLFAAYSSIYLQKITVINSYPRSVEMILIVIYCFVFFDKSIAAGNEIPWKANPLNWFVTGIAFFFACTFLITIFANVTMKASMNLFRVTWVVYNCFILLAHTFYTVGFLKCRK